jgi:hypothetical protein
MIFGVPAFVVEQGVTWITFGYGMYLTMAVIRGGDERLARTGKQVASRRPRAGLPARLRRDLPQRSPSAMTASISPP